MAMNVEERRDLGGTLKIKQVIVKILNFTERNIEVKGNNGKNVR
tara:strand:+ start:221 stop:352 length:132 start_codon:yes stop_codon:yes gene_type:complete